MKSYFTLLIFLISLIGITTAQEPDWGSYVALDQSESIVVAKMRVQDLEEGLGVLEVSEVLKGEGDIREVEVRFTDRHQNKENTKQAVPPTYWYTDGQEGTWLLVKRSHDGRYDLRADHLYYEKKWRNWILEKLTALESRAWSGIHNGLSASVIVDDVGANTLYRFFYLCLRNDTSTPLYINTHYRIHDSAHERVEAVLVTPGGKPIDMIHGRDPGARLSGEPGWPTPMMRDFVKLLPNQRLYLFASGDLRSFFRNPEPGFYAFQAAYKNNDDSPGVEGRVWKGKIVFPVVQFRY